MADQFMKDLERAVKASPNYDPKVARRCVLFEAILEGDAAKFSRLEGESAVDPIEEPKWKFKRSVPKEDSGYVTFTDDKGDLVKLAITDENGKVRRLVPKGSGYEILEDDDYRPKPSGHATTKDEKLAEAFYRVLKQMEKLDQEVLASRRIRKLQELLALKRQRTQEELGAVPIPGDRDVGEAGRGGDQRRLYNQDKGMESGFPTNDQYTSVYDDTLSTSNKPDKAFAATSEEEAMDKVDDAGGTTGAAAGSSMQDHSHQGGSGRSCIGP